MGYRGISQFLKHQLINRCCFFLLFILPCNTFVAFFSFPRIFNDPVTKVLIRSSFFSSQNFWFYKKLYPWTIMISISLLQWNIVFSLLVVDIFSSFDVGYLYYYLIRGNNQFWKLKKLYCFFREAYYYQIDALSSSGIIVSYSSWTAILWLYYDKAGVSCKFFER